MCMCFNALAATGWHRMFYLSALPFGSSVPMNGWVSMGSEGNVLLCNIIPSPALFG